MKYHPAAAIFPLDKEHIDHLAEDIKKRGLVMPIEVLDGQIIDGRRRWLACQKAEVEPDIVDADRQASDDPAGYVLSLNLHRRHLTVSQAAMCAARARQYYEDRAKERQKKAGKTHGRGQKVLDNCPEAIDAGNASDQVGELFGTTGKTVDRARHVIRDGIPELAEAVETGLITVSKGDGIAGHTPKMQKDLLTAERERKQSRSPKAKPKKPSDQTARKEGELQGVGVIRANEAVNCLIRIPKNDLLRKRGFQIVTDWIKANP